MNIFTAQFYACALFATAFTTLCLLTPLTVAAATKNGWTGR
jgi:hypothetical protein